MLQSLTSSFNWQPAITEDKTFTQNKEPIDKMAIALRTAYVFAGTMALALRALQNFGREGLISQNTFLAISPAAAQNTLMYSLAMLAVMPLRYSACLSLAVLVSCVAYKYENGRANRELPALLIEQFSKASNNAIDGQLMDYLTAHPAAVDFLIKLIPNKTQVVTSKDDSQTLLQSILSKANTQQFHRLLDKRDPFVDQFACFKHIIDHLETTKQNLRYDDFILMLIHKKPAFALYALSKGVVNKAPASREVVKCWLVVEDDQIAAQLAKYPGYDINTQHDGKTALSNLIIKLCNPQFFADNPAPLSFLFNFGAVYDANILEIEHTFKIDNQNETKSIQQWLKGRPKVIAAIIQAQTYPKTKTDEVFCSDSFFNFPAVIMSKNTMMVDSGITILQTFSIAAAVYVPALTLTLRVTQKFVPIITFGIGLPALVGILLHQYAWGKATQKLTEIAIEEFIKNPFHRPAVTDYLYGTPTALAALIKLNPPMLHKQDANGITLWEKLFKFSFFRKQSFESFAIFAPELFNKATYDQKVDLFISALRAEDAKYARFIIDQQLLDLSKLTDLQAAECWKSCRSTEALILLKANNVNIEARDKKGYTPLLWAATNHVFNKYIFIENLLMLEADKTAVVTLTNSKNETKEWTAVELAEELNIKTLITNYKAQ